MHLFLFLLHLSFIVLVEITFYIIRITTLFPGLINLGIPPCDTIDFFPIGTVIPIFDRYGYPVFCLVTRDLSFQPDDPQTLMSAFSSFFHTTYLFDLPTLALERNNFSYDDNLLQSAYNVLDHHASLLGVHFYFHQVSVSS